jgi:serine beta-lactamase-like protein LACTB
MFRWASISKSLIAVIAINLVRDGLLDLDEPIKSYLEFYKTPEVLHSDGTNYDIVNGPEITPRMLLNHTAGIQHYENGDSSPEPTEFFFAQLNFKGNYKAAIHYFITNPLVHIPGDTHDYSTFGYNLLGVILEAAARMPLVQLIENYVKRSSGLTKIQPDYQWKTIKGRAKGYHLNDDETHLVREEETDVSWKLAGGGLISSAEDLALYCKALLQEETLLTAMEKDEMWSPFIDSEGLDAEYGLGFQISKRFGLPMIYHSGSQLKTNTRMVMIPEENICVVLMSNYTHISLKEISDEILELILQPQELSFHSDE